MGWNCLSIYKLERCRCWSLWMDKKFHPTFYWACDYLSKLGLHFFQVSKWRGPWLYNHKVKKHNTAVCICYGIYRWLIARLLTHWSYFNLAQSHRYHRLRERRCIPCAIGFSADCCPFQVHSTGNILMTAGAGWSCFWITGRVHAQPSTHK